jgi:hypothetical protein
MLPIERRKPMLHLGGVLKVSLIRKKAGKDKHSSLFQRSDNDKNTLFHQSCLNKVGHLRVCKQSKRGWEPQFFY